MTLTFKRPALNENYVYTQANYTQYLSTIPYKHCNDAPATNFAKYQRISYYIGAINIPFH